MIQLKDEIIEKLGAKGVLAYVAASYAGCGIYTSAQLAGCVNSTTSMMRDGMQELAVHHSDLVQWLKSDKRWKVAGAESDGRFGIVEDETVRRTALIDDLKIAWEKLNPELDFVFGKPDGNAVKHFLKRNIAWSQRDWRSALNNRHRSEINKNEPVYRFLSRLEEYRSGPLDRFMKPMVNGGGAHGKAITREQQNSAARQAAVAGATNRA